MRRASALAAAALLGACTVEVDGAPCAVAGATVDCPSGQACGNNLRCSARALACAASRCTPVTDDLCLDGIGTASGTALARRCVDVDPVCGRWVEEECAGRGLLCGGRPAAARCECPANATPDLLVLPGGGRGETPRPTGVASPLACAFGTLTGALTRARELRTVDPSSALTVSVMGVAQDTAFTFSGATGERFPLVVPSGVRVTSDAAKRGGSYEIVFDVVSATSAAVELESGSSLSDFTIRNDAGDESSIGIDATCVGSGASISLARVSVEARGASGARLGVGFRGGAPCSVNANGLVVRGASASGVAWAPPRWADQLSLWNATVAENGAGLVATGGRASLTEVRVERNVGRGVEAVSTGISVVNSMIVRNGDTGLVFRETNASVQGTTVWGNGASTTWVGGLSGATRRAGGIVFAVRQPPAYQVSLSLNRIYWNSGDQLLFVGPSSSAWTVGAKDIGACSYANSFGCYDPTPAPVSYRGIVALDVDLAEYSQRWDPSGEWESVARLPSGSITRWADCQWDGPPLDCSSEDPPQQ